MNKYSNVLTVRQLKIIVISLVLLLAFFIAPFDETILTVNEELFVIISFFIFVDLFGNTIMFAIADMTDTRIRVATQKLSILLIQKFTGFAELYGNLINLVQLALFRKKLIQKFRANFNRVARNRFRDFYYLLSHINYVIYKAAVNTEFFNYKLISNFAAKKAGRKLTDVMVTQIVDKAKAKRAAVAKRKADAAAALIPPVRSFFSRPQPKKKVKKPNSLRSIFKRNFAFQVVKLQTFMIIRNKKTIVL
jgi:hypothetical protein